MREITFPTCSPFVLRDVPAARRRPIDGVGTLFLPAGVRPGERRGAVVVMEGLGGVIEERELRYARRMAELGHVALAVDSFRARGAHPLSHERRALRVTEAMMLADAHAALRCLCEHPMVDPDRVAVMGFSYGGMISMIAAHRQIAELFAPDGERFAGHASYYGCSVARFERVDTTGAPVALFVGERDRNVCVEKTRAIADDLRRGGSDVWLRVYPGAYHQWDGSDREKRHVRHSLARLQTIVAPDGRVRDARTGLEIRGPISRSLFLVLGVSRRGYDILRDEATLERSDRDLAAFMERAVGGAAVARHAAE